MGLIKVDDKENLFLKVTDSIKELVLIEKPYLKVHSNHLFYSGDNHLDNWVSPFSDDLIEIPVLRFGRYLNYWFNYKPIELYSQLVFGDRNLRVIDDHTGKLTSFRGLTRGYANSSDFSSHFHKVQTNRGMNPVEHSKMRIYFAYNRLVKLIEGHPTFYFYLATIKNSELIKFGVTQYNNIERRKFGGYGNFDGSNYDNVILLAEGPSEIMIKLERDYKLLNLNTEELINKSDLDDLINYIKHYHNDIVLHNLNNLFADNI